MRSLTVTRFRRPIGITLLVYNLATMQPRKSLVSR